MAGGGNQNSQCLDTGNDKETSNRASWNEVQRAFLVELLLEFDRPFARQQNRWGSVAWNEMTKRFNAKFPNTNFSLKQIKEQEHTLKKQYKTIQHLRDQSGFGWDYTNNMVTAPEEVWAPLLKDKEIKRWYNKPFPYYDDLHKVYCGSIATGKRRRGSNYYTNNEAEFESPSPTIPFFDVDDDFLATQLQNSPVCTQSNLNFTQEPPPIQLVISTPDPIPRNLRTIKKRSAISKFHDDYLACKREEAKLISDAIKEKSVRIAARDEKFSVTVAMDAFQELEGFDMADFVFASNLFIADVRMCEAFMACKGERRAGWIKAMIEQNKAKQ